MRLKGLTISYVILQSKTIAEERAEKINAKLGYRPQQEEEKEPEAPPVETFKRYEEELEINDFPQTARWKVTSKVSKISSRIVIFHFVDFMIENWKLLVLFSPLYNGQMIIFILEVICNMMRNCNPNFLTCNSNSEDHDLKSYLWKRMKNSVCHVTAGHNMSISKTYLFTLPWHREKHTCVQITGPKKREWRIQFFPYISLSVPQEDFEIVIQN